MLTSFFFLLYIQMRHFQCAKLAESLWAGLIVLDGNCAYTISNVLSNKHTLFFAVRFARCVADLFQIFGVRLVVVQYLFGLLCCCAVCEHVLHAAKIWLFLTLPHGALS